MDDLYVGEPQGDGKAQHRRCDDREKVPPLRRQRLRIRQACAISAVVVPGQSPPKTVQVPTVKSLLGPFDTVGKADPRHGSINPCAHLSGNPVFPFKATFDDILGLRRQSQTGAEAECLVSISVDAASRAHHHWLRPCAACAKKAAQEKPKKQRGKLIAEEMQGSEANKAADGVYKRTVHWVRRQEERVKSCRPAGPISYWRLPE